MLATLLVQNGTLRVGEIVIAGEAYGKVKAMFDHLGNPIRQAPPSTPASVLGLSDVPHAGDLFYVVNTEREAKLLIKERHEQPTPVAAAGPGLTLEQIFAAFQAGAAKELRLVVKADVQGSLEPIISSLKALSVGDIGINVLHWATGNIGEDDVMLAAASEAIVIGFNVTPDQAAKRLAETRRVDIRVYDVIYRLTEDIEKALKGMLEPEKRTTEIGRAEVLQVFRITKIGNIAGSRVTSGELRRNAKVRVVRGEEVLHEGSISSLKHEKDDAREVREGFECGVGLKGFDAFEPGDTLVAFIEEMVAVE